MSQEKIAEVIFFLCNKKKEDGLAKVVLEESKIEPCPEIEDPDLYREEDYLDSFLEDFTK